MRANMDLSLYQEKGVLYMEEKTFLKSFFLENIDSKING